MDTLDLSGNFWLVLVLSYICVYILLGSKKVSITGVFRYFLKTIQSLTSTYQRIF